MNSATVNNDVAALGDLVSVRAQFVLSKLICYN